MSRALYVIGSLVCFGGAAGLFFYSRRQKPQEEKPAEAAPAPKPEVKEPAPAKAPATPAKTAKETSADEFIKGNPDAIFGKNIVAKNDNSAIYTTTQKLVERTKKDQVLGKPFKHTLTSNGSYNLKYQDANGNYRIINSAAVKVLL